MTLFYIYLILFSKPEQSMKIRKEIRYIGCQRTYSNFFRCQGCIQTDVLSGNDKRLTIAFVRLQMKIINTSQKRKKHCQSDKHKK